MSLGISFGANKTNSKGSEKVDTTTTQNQTQSGTQSTSGTTTTNGSTSQTSNTTGQQSQSATGSQTQQGSTVGTGTQTSSLFSGDVLGGIEGAVKALFGSLGGPAKIDASSLNGFDPASFINDGVAAAGSKLQTGLDESIGGLKDTVGGNAATNSAVALLQNRLQGDAQAQLAGVKGQLTGQAEDITRNNVLAANTVNSTSNQFLATLLDVLKGGATTTNTSQAENTAQTGTSASNTSGTSSEQSSQNATTQQTQTQQLIEMMSQLLSGVTNTKGQTDTTGNVVKFGGGASASI